VTQDHDAIEELLAGYVLRALTGEDAREADRLLTEHVPTCHVCRETLADFRSVAADLALETRPLEPPETLLPRLHRDMAAPQERRRSPLSGVAVAAGFIAVVGMAGFAVSQGIRATNAQHERNLVTELAYYATRPGASTVPLTSQSSPSSSDVTEVSAPGETVVYLVGHDVPPPLDGRVYRVWLGSSNGTFRLVREFVPEGRLTVIPLEVDASVTQIVITEEPAGSAAPTPVEQLVRWRSAA
jgi:hypothetical protein